MARIANRQWIEPHSGRDVSTDDHRQEQLWTDRIAKEPDIISDIASFVAALHTRIVDSPPVSPVNEPHSDDE